MLALLLSGHAFAPAGRALAPAAPRAAPPVMETKAELEALAKELNPAIGFWDPLGLADQEFWNESNEATIGFLRHAELKHGRVAMAGFVGYCVHAQGKTFPWPMSGGSFGGAPPGQLVIEGSHLVPNSAWFPTVNGGNWPELVNGDVPALWDQLSDAAKYQILMCIFFLEVWGESSAGGTTHYMRPGGKPGFYPPFEGVPHPVPIKKLWDPFGFTSKMSPEKKAKSLRAEINNGRLAMLGLFAFFCEARVPGSVPGLEGKIAASSAMSIAMEPFTHPLI